MSENEWEPTEDTPPCPVCQSTSAEKIVLRTNPDEDLYGDPDREMYNDPDVAPTVNERTVVRCNNCGVLFDALVRRRHLD